MLRRHDGGVGMYGREFDYSLIISCLANQTVSLMLLPAEGPGDDTGNR